MNNPQNGCLKNMSSIWLLISCECYYSSYSFPAPSVRKTKGNMEAVSSSGIFTVASKRSARIEFIQICSLLPRRIMQMSSGMNNPEKAGNARHFACSKPPLPLKTKHNTKQYSPPRILLLFSFLDSLRFCLFGFVVYKLGVNCQLGLLLRWL